MYMYCRYICIEYNNVSQHNIFLHLKPCSIETKRIFNRNSQAAIKFDRMRARLLRTHKKILFCWLLQRWALITYFAHSFAALTHSACSDGCSHTYIIAQKIVSRWSCCCVHNAFILYSGAHESWDFILEFNFIFKA